MIPVSRPSTGQEEVEAVAAVLASGWLGLGSTTFAFEEALRQYLGCRNVVAVNTCTSAIHLALDGCGIGPGDEVIAPSLTFVACAQAILATGATPVFCESRERDLLIDVEDLAARITPRTRAVIPVHYCGNACDMDALLALGRRHGFRVVEDAAHGFGSTYRGRKLGSFGDLTCFSFDPIKNITCGEGGAIALADDELAEMLRRKRILGIDKDAWHRHENTRSWFYEVTTRGYRYHMPNFCAAIGLVQLRKVDQFIRRRRQICRAYDAAFADLRQVKPLCINYDETAPHVYIVRVVSGRRDEFMAHLHARGVATGVQYIANHLHPVCRQYARSPLPRVEALWQQVVTVPLYYDMTDDNVTTVIDAVCTFDRL